MALKFECCPCNLHGMTKAQAKFHNQTEHKDTPMLDVKTVVIMGTPEQKAYVRRAVNNFYETREILMFLGHWLIDGRMPQASTLFSDDQTIKEKILSVIEKIEGGKQ